MSEPRTSLARGALAALVHAGALGGLLLVGMGAGDRALDPVVVALACGGLLAYGWSLHADVAFARARMAELGELWEAFRAQGAELARLRSGGLR